MDGHRSAREEGHGPWRDLARWGFSAFAVIAAFLLVVEHRALAFAYLPLLLLACPLLHLVLHGRHGGHRHGGEQRTRGSTSELNRSSLQTDAADGDRGR